MQRGARSFNLKPFKNEALNLLFDDIATFHQRKTKNVLIVEDNELESSQIAKMLDNGDLIEIEIASTGQDGLKLIKEKTFDCIIVDSMLPDIAGMEFVAEINQINKLQLTPTIIYSAKNFNVKEKTQLKQYAIVFFLKM